MLRKFKKIRKALRTLLLIILLAVVFILVPLKSQTVSSAFMLSMHTDSAPALVAHRGLSSLYPENTLPAFEGAYEYGFDAFELDIHTTKDGEWVVIHDDDVNYMTDSEGDVEGYTLKELREMKLVSGSNIEDYPDVKMPTLRETLELCVELDIPPVIEIKKCDLQYLPSLKKMLDEFGISQKTRIISFTKEYLEEYRRLDGEIEILYLANTPTKEDIDWCAEHNFGINFNHLCLYKCFDAIRYAKEKDITIAVWTVDIPLFADIMVLLGADYVTTNKILP